LARVAVVTGAGGEQGIGAAIGRALTADGWRVIGSDVRVPDAGAGPDFVVTDVRDPAAVEALADVAIDRFGRLDAWINNAGVNVGLGPLTDVDDATWAANLDVIASGTFHGCRAAARRMLAREPGWGRIVNVASQAGRHGVPLMGPYCAAKFAVIGLTQSLAAELTRSGVTVNAVCPGTVDTPLLDQPGGVWDTMGRVRGQTAQHFKGRALRALPLGRLVTPSEVAATVAFLCRDEAAAISGASVDVTGAESMH
jgi:NAD(P)-dependent dehydrogenase (short-subunit alcohol dehydrogenase family)